MSGGGIVMNCAVLSSMHELAGQVKQRAREAGFDLVGIAPANPSRYRGYLRQWLDDGQAGTMHWLEKRFEERTDPGVYLPGAASVVCVAMNYYVPLEEDAHRDLLAGSRCFRALQPEYRQKEKVEEYRERESQGNRVGKVARYALGEDYHEVMKRRLHGLADWIRQRVPEARTRACVDTAPVMEKELAARAGVGWIGKNTCVINEQIGSWVLLGEIVTTLPLPADEPAIDRCGSCRRCIDACPTGAITALYQLDARRCISYLTIEHREAIAGEFHRPIGEWIFGCDICQEVCPWNGKAPIATVEALRPRFAGGTVDVDEVLKWSEEEYRSKLRGSAMKRVKLPVLKRNARIVAANLGPTD